MPKFRVNAFGKTASNFNVQHLGGLKKQGNWTLGRVCTHVQVEFSVRYRSRLAEEKEIKEGGSVGAREKRRVRSKGTTGRFLGWLEYVSISRMPLTCL